MTTLSDENDEMTERYGSEENYDSKENQESDESYENEENHDSKENLMSVENNEQHEIQEESGELQEGEISRSVLKVNFPYLGNL